MDRDSVCEKEKKCVFATVRELNREFLCVMKGREKAKRKKKANWWRKKERKREFLYMIARVSVFHCGKGTEVLCVCVWERERDRERKKERVWALEIEWVIPRDREIGRKCLISLFLVSPRLKWMLAESFILKCHFLSERSISIFEGFSR